MNPLSWLGSTTLLGALALAAGCNPEVVVESGEGGGGAGGTTTVTTHTGGTGNTGGSTTVTTSTPTGMGGSGGSAGACAAWQDEQGLAPTTIRFRNESGQPIYLPANCGSLLYDLSAGDDVVYGFDPFCLQTCEDLQTEGPIDCAPCAPSTVLLPPGGTHDVVWDGTGLLATDMPDECWAYPGSQGGCSQLVAGPQGLYRISAMGYASCSGDCTCDYSGVCSGWATGAEAWADSTQFQYPTAAVVEVVFGVCAFPCPEG